MANPIARLRALKLPRLSDLVLPRVQVSAAARGSTGALPNLTASSDTVPTTDTAAFRIFSEAPPTIPLVATRRRFPSLARFLLSVPPMNLLFGVPSGEPRLRTLPKPSGDDPATVMIGSGLAALGHHISTSAPTVGTMFHTENWLVLAALAATSLGIPEVTTSIKISGGRFDHRHPLFPLLKEALQDPAIQADAQFIAEYGASAYYRAPAVRDAMPESIRIGVDAYLFGKATPNPIQMVDQFVRAALQVRTLIDEELPLAEAGQFIIGDKWEPGQRSPFTLGNEIEVAPPDYDPDPILTKLFLDPMMESLADQLRGLGYGVKLNISQESHFKAKAIDPRNPASIPFTFRYTNFTTQEGRHFVTELMRGTGAFLLTVKEINPTTREVLSSRTHHLKVVRNDDQQVVLDAAGRPMRIQSIFDCTSSLLWHVGNRIGLEDSARELRAAIASGEITMTSVFLILVKGADDNILKIRADIDLQKGMAHLTPLNGQFTIDGISHIVIPTSPPTADDPYRHAIDAVVAELGKRIGGKKYALRLDRITDMEISRPEVDLPPLTVKALYEQHPFAEFVTGIMTPAQIPVWKDVVRSMRKLGWKGTANDRLVGRHIHGGVAAKTVDGQWTVRPLQNLILAFEEWSPVLRQLFPSNPNRGGFNNDTAQEVLDFLNDPEFNPENPDHILMFALTMAAFNPQKYLATNPDNAIGKIGRNMIGDGTYSALETGKTVIWKGQDYKFKIERGDDGAVQIVGELPSGEKWNCLRVTEDGGKWTYETRFPDTVPSEQHDVLLIQTIMALYHRFAHAPMLRSAPTGDQ